MAKETKKKKTNPWQIIYYAPLIKRNTIANWAMLSFALVVISVVILLVIDPDPSPESILEQHITDYQYFLADRGITDYINEAGFQSSEVLIKTNVSPEKIPELLKTNILKDCDRDGLQCRTSEWFLWYHGGNLDRFNTPIVAHPDISLDSPGEMCLSAVDPQFPESRRTDICVDRDTGMLTFQRLRL